MQREPMGPEPTTVPRKTKADWAQAPGMEKVREERDALDVCLKTAAHDKSCDCDHCSMEIRCPHCRRVGCQNPEHVAAVKNTRSR